MLETIHMHGNLYKYNNAFVADKNLKLMRAIVSKECPGRNKSTIIKSYRLLDSFVHDIILKNIPFASKNGI